MGLAEAPGVKTFTGSDFSAVESWGVSPQARRPSVQRSAVSSSLPSEQKGRKSSGLASGNTRSLFVRSPLGSMTSVGIPERAASSRRSTMRPVLPEPVIPITTACVVKRSGERRASAPAWSPSNLPKKKSLAMRASLCL